MKLHNLLLDHEFAGTVTTDHPASSYGQAVVVVAGQAIDPIGWQITEASRAELAQLPAWWRAMAQEVQS